MLTFKATDSRLIDCAHQIKQGNAMISKGKKMSDSGKEFVTKWLLNERDLDVESLPIDSTILIQVDGLDTLRLTVKGQNRLDVKWLQLDAPLVAAKYTKENPTVYFDSLLTIEARADDQELINATLRSLSAVKGAR